MEAPILPRKKPQVRHRVNRLIAARQIVKTR
jgi:hypothetical protein